jgi:hypothetical protein
MTEDTEQAFGYGLQATDRVTLFGREPEARSPKPVADPVASVVKIS